MVRLRDCFDFVIHGFLLSLEVFGCFLREGKVEFRIHTVRSHVHIELKMEVKGYELDYEYKCV